MVALGCRLYLLQVTAASFGDRLFVVLTTNCVVRVLVMYCLVWGIAESKICIEQQIMFLCDCKCAVHLTQLSISQLMASTGHVVDWGRLFIGCRAFRRARMLTLNIDLFNLKKPSHNHQNYVFLVFVYLLKFKNNPRIWFVNHEQATNA